VCTLAGLKNKYLQIAYNPAAAPLTKTRAGLLWNGAVTRQAFLSDGDVANLLKGLKMHDESQLQQLYTTVQYVLQISDHGQKEKILAQLQKNNANSTGYGIQTRASLASALDRFASTTHQVKDLQKKIEAELLANKVC
jgi:hypothetical protein